MRFWWRQKPRIRRNFGQWEASTQHMSATYVCVGSTPHAAWHLFRWGLDGYRNEAT